jgi:type VI secretion system protein ImpG
MDPRLLRYYNLELQHLHEMGAEFAQEFPKIAARLGMNGLEVADPYVERLIEGVGFLAARVQLKLDAEFPRFTQALLEILHPHYLAPTPAMLVAQLTPDPREKNLARGVRRVPRGTALTALQGGDDQAACEFRTGHDVTLWPVEVAAASYFSFAPDLPLNALPIAQRIRGGLRIRLRATAGLTLAEAALDRLPLFLTGRDDVANRLAELCLGACIGVIVVPTKATPRWHEFLPPSHVRPIGYRADEALLPPTPRTFQGYRLLQEYFAFPQRFRFMEITGLGPAVSRVAGPELEVVLLFGRAEPAFESVVDASNLAMHCVPAVNLFPKRADRIHVSDAAHEYHVVVDRTRPLDYEVYEVTEVTGHGIGTESQQDFLPFYASYSTTASAEHSAYFTTRREPRVASSAQKRRGPRSSYVGSEVFLSLVDAEEAPFSASLRQLSLQTVCTNRDLVLQMPLGAGATDFTLDIAAPVVSVRAVAGPSRPKAPLVDGAVAWRAISHLALNYLSLVNTSAREGAAALRDLLELYAPSTDAAAHRQIEGIRTVDVAPVVRRMAGRGPLAFGRGLQVTLGVDDLAFEGGSAFQLAAVLHQYLTRHVSINSFVETVLRSDVRGEISRWEPQWGERPTL